MRNNNCNLVVLHHEEVFETRELAIAYLTDYYKPNSLDSEPIVVKYGDTRNPNVILAFGTSNTTPGSYYAIDMAKAEEQIDSLVETVEADSEELEGLAEALDNIITAAGLTVDENRIHNKIYYQPGNIRDAIIGNAQSISEAVDLISNYVQQEIGGSSFNVESTDSINMIYLVDGKTKTLKAEVKISKYGESDDLDFNNNIIGVKSDGIYAASHLTYDDARHQLIFTTSGYKDGVFKDDAIVQRVDLGEHTNVNGAETDTALTEVTHENNEAQVKTNVKLGSTNSIVVRNGGLEANITIDIDASTNKLILTVGNQTITKNLPGVELFESAEYNDANEELIITFRTGKTLVIPIHGIIHTWNTSNSENSPIVLTKDVVTGGTDTLSGSIKLRSTDNLIGIENGKLYVSEQAVNDKVSAETSRATNAENVIQTQINSLQNSLNEETTRANAAESEIRTIANHADEIALEAKETVNSLNGTVNELSTSLSTLETTVSGIAEDVTEIATLRNALTDEITNRTNKDIEIEGAISAANTAIQTETARATAAETAFSRRIDELQETIGASSVQTLADAKAYTDTKVLAEENARVAKDTELGNAITTAVRDASDDATAKASAAETAAKSYTDEQVLAEKQRAEAAEQSLATDVNKKIESVEIVKNSQSDLQYILKVDGQDAGEINIPKDQFLKSAEYDATSKNLIFVFETSDGTVTTNVNVSDLVDTYTAGNGLILNENQFAVKINEDSESYLTISEEGIKLLGIDTKFAETTANAKSYTDEQVLVEKTAREAKDVELEATLENKANASDVYTKTEIDNKGYLTEHQDISNLATIASVEAVETMAEDNATAIQELGAEVEDMKFVTNETNTVRMTMVKETGAEARVLSSDVKLKTISGENANIIKSDANGLYATVTFDYDKATNKITFNDGNGSKAFELNNFGILQDAFYDSENKSIVLVVKKNDETTERITIPVADLVNDWSVENKQNSPVVLQKTDGENGDVLSADISILNNVNNLLVNDNGSLFVDGDCNSHKALWGNEVTNVQGVINILFGAYNDIEKIKQDIADLEEDNENIKNTLADLQEDLDNEKEHIATNTSDIADIKERVENLENGLSDLTITVNNFDNRITEADNKAQQALDAIEGLGTSLSNRIDRIEEILEQLIDFGEYDIQL